MVTVRCLLGLLVVGPLLASARCTSERKQKGISGIIQHLCDLGELRPKSCMKEVENMRVVRPKTPSERSRPLVMEWSFRLASELFQKSATPTSWKARELQHLRDLLGQQTQCFDFAGSAAAVGGAEVEQWRTFWTSLDHFLTEQGFSACAWESVRPIVLSVMQNLCRCKKSRTRRSTRHNTRCTCA
ncbi:hypothetical protein SRHO_G00014010 [Serrasalmus rhombeus]